MKRNKHIGSFGTVSHATLRAQDLIPAFAHELRTLARKGTKHKALALQCERELARFERAEMTFERKPSNTFGDHSNVPDLETLGECVESLSDALNEYAPAYAFFGSHPGDGSDFGYWLSEFMSEDFDGLKVSDTSEVPRSYRGKAFAFRRR